MLNLPHFYRASSVFGRAPTGKWEMPNGPIRERALYFCYVIIKLVNDMPAPLFSEDLRWWVICFVHVLQHSVAEASFFLGVSERTDERFISKFLVTDIQFTISRLLIQRSSRESVCYMHVLARHISNSDVILL